MSGDGLVVSRWMVPLQIAGDRFQSSFFPEIGPTQGREVPGRYGMQPSRHTFDAPRLTVQLRQIHELTVDLRVVTYVLSELRTKGEFGSVCTSMTCQL